MTFSHARESVFSLYVPGFQKNILMGYNQTSNTFDTSFKGEVVDGDVYIYNNDWDLSCFVYTEDGKTVACFRLHDYDDKLYEMMKS